MNKTELVAYEWLKRQGAKDIIHQKARTPDFLTDIGNFEVKRAYLMKTGQIKIIFTSDKQKEVIISNEASTLVFSEKEKEPLDIIKFEELEKNPDIVRNVILFVPKGNKKVCTWTIEEELLTRIFKYKERTYPYLSKSALIEVLLTEAMGPHTKDLSVAR